MLRKAIRLSAAFALLVTSQTVATIVLLPAWTGTASAAAACLPGYVWRDAQDGDGVCVTPQERQDAKLQNANGPNNRAAGGGDYGPNTCRQGYVWREAFGGDVVCVTPYERSQARRQNRNGPSHTAN